jgi:hypothetical protein
MRVVDTTSSVLVDSVLVHYYEHQLPITFPSGGGISMGKIKMRFMYSGKPLFRLAADTTNGYEIQNVHWRTFGGYRYGAGNNSLVGEAEGVIQRGGSSATWVNTNLITPCSRCYGFYIVASLLPYSGRGLFIQSYQTIYGNTNAMVELEIQYFKEPGSPPVSLPVQIVEESP